jgi:hypothetical protein
LTIQQSSFKYKIYKVKLNWPLILVEKQVEPYLFFLHYRTSLVIDLHICVTMFGINEFIWH